MLFIIRAQDVMSDVCPVTINGNHDKTDQWQNFGVSYGVVSRFTDHVLSIWYVNGGFRSGAAHGFDELCTANFDPETGLRYCQQDAALYRSLLREYVRGAEAKQAKMGEFIRELGDAVERVELLPYHEMGKHKWAFFNDPYQLNDIHPPKADTMNRLKNILKEYHNEVY